QKASIRAAAARKVRLKSSSVRSELRRERRSRTDCSPAGGAVCWTSSSTASRNQVSPPARLRAELRRLVSTGGNRPNLHQRRRPGWQRRHANWICLGYLTDE